MTPAITITKTDAPVATILTITKTGAPVATIRLGIEVQIPDKNGPEFDEAFSRLGSILRGLFPTESERAVFLDELRAQFDAAKRS